MELPHGKDHGEWRGIRGATVITDIKTSTTANYSLNETRTKTSNPFNNIKEINPPDREPYKNRNRYEKGFVGDIWRNKNSPYGFKQ